MLDAVSRIEDRRGTGRLTPPARHSVDDFDSVRALDICGQATKGAWGMSWRQKTMTGVEDCEKSGVVVKQTLIPEFPNQPALNP